jgi:hypothetical protein
MAQPVYDAITHAGKKAAMDLVEKSKKAEQPKRVPAVSAEKVRDGNGLAMGLKLTFANGRKLTVLGDQLNDTIRYEGLWHGISAKLVDAAAISRNPDTGASATIADKMAAVQRVYDRITGPDGRWNEEREGGGATPFLLQALCQLKPNKSADELKEWLGTKSDAEKAGLETNPAIAPIIAKLKADRAAAKAKDVDLDKLNAELEALGTDEE